MAIKVHSRFATADDTAEVLGVPRSRVAELIRTIEAFQERARNGDQMKRRVSDSPIRVKRSGRNAQTRAKAKSKAAYR